MIVVLLVSTSVGISFRSINTAFISDLENMLQPVALIFLMLFLIDFNSRNKIKTNYNELLIYLTQLYVTLISIHTLLVIAQYFFDLWDVLNYFNGATSESAIEYGAGFGSIAEREATSGGRLIGIFSLPVQSGIAYSVGLLCWIFLASTARARKIIPADILKLVLIFVGGTLSFSKVFVIGGYFLFLLYSITSRLVIRPSLIKKIPLIVACGVGLYFYIFQEWFLKFQNFSYLFFSSNSSDNIILHYTAGRIGGETHVTKFLQILMHKSPIVGMGFGSQFEVNLPYDNGYLEFVFPAGLLGGIAFGFIIIILISKAFFLIIKDKKEGQLLLYLVILILGGSLGGTVLLVNRISIIIWLIIILIFYGNRAVVKPT